MVNRQLIGEHILKGEALLRHLAHHPDGLLSNEPYRHGIIEWAKDFQEE